MKTQRHRVCLALLVVGAACSGPSQLHERRWIDLTHTFDATTIYWPTASGFEFTQDSKGMTAGGYWYEANTLKTAEHGGTHLDAPVHFAEGHRSVDEIPLAQLVGPGVVVDVTDACAADRDHEVTVAELETWERVHGRIPEGAIVLLNTGSARFWPDRARCMGTDERGAEAVAKLHFPGLHPEAARWLLGRSIGAVGLDTPSIDRGQSKTFESHRILFASNVPALENVTHLDELPPTGSVVIALPMKIRRGSGGPVRIAALVE